MQKVELDKSALMGFKTLPTQERSQAAIDAKIGDTKPGSKLAATAGAIQPGLGSKLGSKIGGKV